MYKENERMKDKEKIYVNKETKVKKKSNRRKKITRGKITGKKRKKTPVEKEKQVK